MNSAVWQRPTYQPKPVSDERHRALIQAALLIAATRDER